jgi:flagellar motor switch protein FliM
MGQILTQEEVDALLRGMEGGDISRERADSGKRNEAWITRPYDFASHDKIVRGKLPQLDAVNERYCRLFRVRLSNMLRKMGTISYASLETLSLGNFMRSVSVPSSINIIRSEKFNISGLIILETKLVISLIDLFFGGKGGAGSGYKMEGREFTSIEQSMLEKVAVGAVKDLNEAFKPVADLDLVYVRNESNPQFTGILKDNDTVIVAEFEAGLEHVSGSVMVCLPYTLIELIKPGFGAGASGSPSSSADRKWTEQFMGHLNSVPVEISVRLGNSRLTGRQIANLKKGDVIMLDNSPDGEVEVNVQGETKFYGRAGTLGKNLAVEIIRACKGKA